MCSILDIKLVSQKMNNNNYEFMVKGFVLKYNGVNYIISIHHHLPIYKVFYDIELKININSCWSEVLILEYNLSNFIIYKKIHISLPKPDTLLYLNSIELVVSDITYIKEPFYSVYIVCQTKNKNKAYNEAVFKNLQGLSGLPVFCDKKRKNIIGILSKIINNTILLIPIYVVMKNLKKNNNNYIYTISETICNTTLYHPNLKYKIPCELYIILEGDEGEYLNINKNRYMYIENEKLKIFCCKDLQPHNKTIFPCTYRLLMLLKKLDFNIFQIIIKQLKEFNCLIIMSKDLVF